MGVVRRPRDVAVVKLRHRRQILQRANLLRELFADADHFVGRPHVVDLGALRMLGLEQALDAVERDAAVIADDPAAAIGIGKPGDDAGLAALHDLGRVSIEDPVVVGLAIIGECFVDLRIGLEAGGLEARLDHAQAAVRENRALEWLIGLQADNDLVVAIDVAGLVREHGRRCFCVDGQNACLLLSLK